LAPYLICAGLVASQAFRSIAIAFPHFKQAGQRESIIVAVPDFPEFTLGSSLSVSLRRTQTRAMRRHSRLRGSDSPNPPMKLAGR
jgi:hypothetical protein